MSQNALSQQGAAVVAEPPASGRFLGLALGSVGIVYGDIGTSPLYAFREAVTSASMRGSGTASPDVVLGVLSLILWALILIVTCKYVLVLLRADNNGEGGTLTLMALMRRLDGGNSALLVCGILGVALFFGDALVTPAITVLAAMEGLSLATSAFSGYTQALAVFFLVVIFALQSRGTAAVGAWFGPIMALWFVVIGVAGLPHLFAHPEVLVALNPMYGLSFLQRHGMIGFGALGAVFLTVTGAEALYAGLGHFGRKPIQTSWFALVLPALALNYLGQASLVMANPESMQNPFFLMFPGWFLLPLVGLATVATAIASQAVITAAHSLARQAVQLGLLPRLEMRHTSAEREGQIFLPRVNTILLIGALFLVVVFRSSSGLASAYGLAANGAMVMTTIMAFVVMWKYWNWSPFVVAALMAPFFIVDLTFLTANLPKIFEGGWLTVTFAAVIAIAMATWQKGTRLLSRASERMEVPLDLLINALEKKPPSRVPGSAVFLTSNPVAAPTALLHMLKHYKVLHEDNVVLTVVTANTPRVLLEDRVKIEPIGMSFTRITLRFGYMESANIPRALAIARKLGWRFDIMSTTFLLSRRLINHSERSQMSGWQDRLFVALARNIAADAATYFQIPTGRLIEVGIQSKV